MSAPTQPTPPWVRTVTVAAVSVVAAVAAVVSYVHVHTLAERAGEQWRAWLLPLSVDGLLVAASMVMLVRRRAGSPAGWLPWLGLGLGLSASLAANVAAAHPEWHTPILDGVVSAWPAVALAVAFELLILVLRDAPRAAARTVADVVPAVEHKLAAASDARSGPVTPPGPDPTEPTPTPPARATPDGSGETPEERRKRLARERTDRSRRHKNGDHTRCDPTRCTSARVRVVS